MVNKMATFNLEDTFIGWGLLAGILAIVIIFTVYGLLIQRKQGRGIWDIFGNIVLTVSFLFPLLWFVDYLQTESILSLDALTLFNDYLPLSIICIAIGYFMKIFDILTMKKQIFNLKKL